MCWCICSRTPPTVGAEAHPHGAVLLDVPQRRGQRSRVEGRPVLLQAVQEEADLSVMDLGTNHRRRSLSVGGAKQNVMC